MVGGAYDAATLEKLNWFLRDWRLNEPTKMDPKLFDIVWEVYRESGSSQGIEVLSGYRSPSTNAMLRMRSRQVAEHSQHMQGRAMDAHFVDVGTAKIRDIGMRMQAGGVGFYPTGSTPWVHLDSGSVRYWPRMSRDALVRLFPDGKTVHIPADGVPLAGYELARAEIESRGGAVMTASASAGANFGIFSWLFGRGGGADDAEESGGVNGAKMASKSAPKAPLEAPKPVEVASEPAATQKPIVLASRDAAAALGEPAQLHDAKALGLLAPLPPRRPADAEIQVALSDVPLPPARPVTSVVADAKPAPSDAKADLIAALLARDAQLPSVITRGVGPRAPRNALALAETQMPQPPERPAMLAKAAAMVVPVLPLPPKKPQAPIAALAGPPQSAEPSGRSASPAQVAAASPFGGLVYEIADGTFGNGDQTATIPAAALLRSAGQ